LTRYVGLLIVLIGAASIAGCGPTPRACTLPHCPFSAQQAMDLPDSQIFYPGSQVVSRSGTDGSNNVNGEPEDAYITTVLNVSATEAEVAAWYQKTLPAAGWRQIEAIIIEANHGFYTFTISPPQSRYSELIHLDFRIPQPPPAGTDYTLTFGVATP
jgi:hypothetical protein